jgi:rod shape-determining protein MreC
VIVFVLLSIVLMTVDHKQNHLESVRSILSTLVYPLQYVVNLPVAATHWLSDSLVTRQKLLEENARLNEDHLKLNSRLQRFAILEEENKRLRELLESSIELRERVLVAELIEVDLEPFRQQIVINKGRNQGVYDGQPIVDANGIMGQIIHVGPFSSTVLLITDTTHALPVQINRNGLRAIAVGTGRDSVLSLENLPTNADMREGDLIISSGLGHRFPRGYPVGTISEIELVPGEAFAQVSVLPSANLGKSREVLLVWPYEQVQQQNSNEDLAANR